MGKNIVHWGRPQLTVWRMRAACWIPKATDTHSVCVMLTAVSTATMVARTRLSVSYSCMTSLVGPLFVILCRSVIFLQLLVL